MSLDVVVVNWSDEPDDVANNIYMELADLGYHPSFFKFDDKIPEYAEVIFTFAPWGRLQQVTRQLADIPASKRPAWVHWNTEDPPDLRIPWPVLLIIGHTRAWFDRLNDSDNSWVSSLPSLPILSLINRRMHKFRYVGEYHYAYLQGYLTILADISKVYANFFNSNGLETMYAPWRLLGNSYADLELERDIDVLWLGTRRTRRRSKLLDKIRAELSIYGIEIYVVDGVENPKLYGQKRTEIFNRAKITLNLLPTWYDNALIYRLPLAAANKSMVISETSLNHCPAYENYLHYVASPPDEIVQTILYYLEHETEREKIAEAAYKMVTQHQKLGDSVKKIMDAVIQSSSCSCPPRP